MIFRDVTDRHRARQELEHEGGHDSLTGLVNRATFRKRLSDSCARPASGGAFAVLFLDLDHFKQVNDTHGHAAGDTLLIEVSKRMRGCVRKSDTVCRMGGDEFVILQAGRPRRPRRCPSRGGSSAFWAAPSGWRRPR